MSPTEGDSTLIQLLQYPAETIALLASGLFAGAMICINAIEHPRFRRGENAAPLAPIAENLRRSEVLLVRLALVTAISAPLATIAGSGMLWLVGGFVHGLTAIYLLTEVRRTRTALDNMQAGESAVAGTPELSAKWAVHSTSLTVTGLCVYFVFLLQI